MSEFTIIFRLQMTFFLMVISLIADASATEYPTFEKNGHSFSCRSVKTSSSTKFGPKSTKHSLSVSGYYHIPLQFSKDIIAADIEAYNPVILDRRGRNLLVGGPSSKKKTSGYCPVHDIGKGGQTANKPINLQYDLSDEAVNIDRLTFSINALEVQKRKLVDRAPLVSEEYTEAVDGLFIRISGLTLKSNRVFTVELSYRRSSAGLGSPFFEGVQVLDVNGKVIGGGRWTYGTPLELKGKFTAKFKLISPDMHHMLRLVIVTETRVVPVTFELKGIFDQ